MPQPEIHNTMELEDPVQESKSLPFFVHFIPQFFIEEFTLHLVLVVDSAEDS